jgi:uncharacterized protein (DUF2235 family)
MGKKRLLFFLDGSGDAAVNAYSAAPTNIVRLNSALTFGQNGIPQIFFYSTGVGTRGDYLSAATGGGLDQIVMESYVNLASNYNYGDSIYIYSAIPVARRQHMH